MVAKVTERIAAEAISVACQRAIEAGATLAVVALEPDGMCRVLVHNQGKDSPHHVNVSRRCPISEAIGVLELCITLLV